MCEEVLCGGVIHADNIVASRFHILNHAYLLRCFASCQLLKKKSVTVLSSEFVYGKVIGKRKCCDARFEIAGIWHVHLAFVKKKSAQCSRYSRQKGTLVVFGVKKNRLSILQSNLSLKTLRLIGRLPQRQSGRWNSFCSGYVKHKVYLQHSINFIVWFAEILNWN